MGQIQEIAKLEFAKSSGVQVMGIPTGTTEQVDIPGVQLVGGGSPLPVSASTQSIGSAGGPDVYTSIADFTATVTTGTNTVVVAGLSFSLTAAHVVAANNAWVVHADGSLDIIPLSTVTVDTGGTVVTFVDLPVVFATGDTVYLEVKGPFKTQDADLDVSKVIDQAPLWTRYSDPEVVVNGTVIGEVDDTWLDQGNEIDVRGMNKLGIWSVLTVQNSTGCQLQVLCKHSSAGADEFVMPSTGSYQTILGSANVKLFHEFDVSMIVPFVQIQTKALDVDTTTGGTTGTVVINITKGYA